MKRWRKCGRTPDESTLCTSRDLMSLVQDLRPRSGETSGQLRRSNLNPAAPSSMDTPEERRRRIRSAVLAITTIIVGLVVHRAGLGLDRVVRDMLGDALWAMMIFYGLGVLLPRARLRTRTASALAICFGVEASQLFHSPRLDALRATLPGHLILGSGFDPRDFLSYSLGVAAAAVVALASAEWS